MECDELPSGGYTWLPGSDDSGAMWEEMTMVEILQKEKYKLRALNYQLSPHQRSSTIKDN